MLNSIKEDRDSVFVEQVTKVIHCIWDTELIANELKNADIIPIFKRNGDKADCTNWRGISVLSIAGKVLSRILLNRLIESIGITLSLSLNVVSVREEAQLTCLWCLF